MPFVRHNVRGPIPTGVPTPRIPRHTTRCRVTVLITVESLCVTVRFVAAEIVGHPAHRFTRHRFTVRQLRRTPPPNIGETVAGQTLSDPLQRTLRSVTHTRRSRVRVVRCTVRFRRVQRRHLLIRFGHGAVTAHQTVVVVFADPKRFRKRTPFIFRNHRPRHVSPPDPGPEPQQPAQHRHPLAACPPTGVPHRQSKSRYSTQSRALHNGFSGRNAAKRPC